MFSYIRGQALTEETFITYRNDAMHDVVVARDRLAAAAQSAGKLAAYSEKTAAQEESNGYASGSW